MRIKYLKDAVEIQNAKFFEPKHIFECGQAFRWHLEEDGSYTVVEKNAVVNVKKEGNIIFFDHCTEQEFKTVWATFFDLAFHYEKARSLLKKDPVLQKALQYGKGIRILRQDYFPTVINFILSANSHIPRIKKSMEILSEEYGSFITTYRNRPYYSFPTAEKLAKISPEELREVAHVGYRDRYIVQTAQMIRDGVVSLEELERLDSEEAFRQLLKLSGVGEKVADCILLFGYHRLDVFPIDVWIHRVMENLYFQKRVSKKEILEKATEKFGKYRGLAQQYLFYYGREKN